MDGTEEGAAGEDASASDEPIIVGGTLGLTGAYSSSSAAYLATYEYWAEQVNADGGILGREVELKIYDDESDPVVAQELFQQLINEDEADLLLGPYATAVGGAVVPITERANKILWDPGFFSKELHSTSDYLVSGWPYQEPEVTLPLFSFFDTLPEDQRPQTVAIVTAQNPFPIVVRDGFDGEGGALQYAEERGMEVVFNEEYNQQATDLTGLVRNAAATDPDVFLALALPNDGSLLATTAEQVGFDPDFYCTCGSQIVTLPNWADLGAAGDGIYTSTTAWPGQPDRPGLDELMSYFEQEFGYEVMPSYGAVSLAILQVMQQAVEGAGTLDQDALRQYVAENEFDTAVGPITYNEDGTVAFAAQLVQAQDGNQTVELIWPLELATAEAQIGQ